MKSFYDLCKWFGDNRVVAFILGMPTLGITWAMAGIGRSIDAVKGGANLLQIWRSSEHCGQLKIAAGIDIVMLLVWSVPGI